MANDPRDFNLSAIAVCIIESARVDSDCDYCSR
jgi:hypothetical protein